MKHGPFNFPVLQALIQEIQLDLLQPDTVRAQTVKPAHHEAYPYWSEEDGIQMWESLAPSEFEVLRDSCARYELWRASLEYRALLCGEIGAA